MVMNFNMQPFQVMKEDTECGVEQEDRVIITRRYDTFSIYSLPQQL